jgi:hypothetical protein
MTEQTRLDWNNRVTANGKMLTILCPIKTQFPKYSGSIRPTRSASEASYLWSDDPVMDTIAMETNSWTYYSTECPKVVDGEDRFKYLETNRRDAE